MNKVLANIASLVNYGHHLKFTSRRFVAINTQVAVDVRTSLGLDDTQHIIDVMRFRKNKIWNYTK